MVDSCPATVLKGCVCVVHVSTHPFLAFTWRSSPPRAHCTRVQILPRHNGRLWRTQCAFLITLYIFTICSPIVHYTFRLTLWIQHARKHDMVKLHKATKAIISCVCAMFLLKSKWRRSKSASTERSNSLCFIPVNEVLVNVRINCWKWRHWDVLTWFKSFHRHAWSKKMEIFGKICT